MNKGEASVYNDGVKEERASGKNLEVTGEGKKGQKISREKAEKL